MTLTFYILDDIENSTEKILYLIAQFRYFIKKMVYVKIATKKSNKFALYIQFFWKTTLNAAPAFGIAYNLTVLKNRTKDESA